MTVNDRDKMIAFISSKLPSDECRLVLAHGTVPGDDIIADVTVYGDDLDIQSNCPEWVDVREVYYHLRWRTMPSWEQQALLRGEAAKIRADAVQKQLDAYTVVANSAPFRFQKVGQLWAVHFTVAGATKIGIFNNHRGLLHLAMLLARRDRSILSIDLDGRSGDPEAMKIIASERQRKAERQCGPDLTPAMLRDALAVLQEKYALAKECRDIECMEEAEEEIARFNEKIGTNESDFQRYVYQEEKPVSLERTIHKSVSTNLRRAYDILREKPELGESMRECVGFLEAHIKPEGFGFAYRPPSHFRPEWSL